MHDLAKRSLEKLEEAWQCHVRANELADEIQQLRKRRDQLFNDAGVLRVTVKILCQDGGPATEADVEALLRAFIAFEEGKSPSEAAEHREEEAQAPVDREPTLPSLLTQQPLSDATNIRLLDAVDAATARLEGEFTSGDVREQLKQLYTGLLNRVHKASITGTLARLVEIRRLERITPGGRGREAIFKRREDAENWPLPPKREKVDVFSVDDL